MLTTASRERLSNQLIHAGEWPTNQLIYEAEQSNQSNQKAGLLYLYWETLLVFPDAAPAAFPEQMTRTLVASAPSLQGLSIKAVMQK